MSSDLLEIFTDERLDASEVLRFTIPAASPKAYLVAPDHELEYEGRAYFILEDEGARDGTKTTRTVEAPALWYRLADLVYVGTLVITAQTPAAGLELILDGTGWTAGPATSTDAATFTMDATDRSRLELLRSWAKITGKYLTWDTIGRQVNLADARGSDLGLAFRYRRNLKRARRRVRPPEVTVLYPYGADGLTISGVNGGDEFIEDFTFYTDQGLTIGEARERFTRSRVWSDSTLLIDSELLTAAQARLEVLAARRLTYELDVVDLTGLTEDSGELAVGDVVRVQDPDFAEDLRATVVRYLRNRKEPWKNRVELSTLTPVLRDSSLNGRPSRTSEWVRFDGPIGADFEIRNDGVFDVARIPLSFRTGGRAHFFVDVAMLGAGDSTTTAYVYDELSDQLVFRSVVVPVADGVTGYARLNFALDEIPAGSYDYRVRLESASDTSPDPTIGIDIPADPEVATLGNAASFYIMTQGAIFQTPPGPPNSITFNTNGDNTDDGSVQLWEVPAGVTEITIEAHGGPGGSVLSTDNLGGRGARIVALFAVTPGDDFEIYVGKQGSCDGQPFGWPNGGMGATGSGGDHGRGGGGATSIRPAGGTFEDSLVIAAGGGGESLNGADGGDGGWLHGEDGAGLAPGLGATQFVPGAGTDLPDQTSIGIADPADGHGVGNAGGDGLTAADGGWGGNGSEYTGIGTDGNGGGGGGRCGGGGGGGAGGDNGGPGGGSSWVAPGGILLEAEDGGAELVGGEDSNGGGKLIISWNDPPV